MILVGNESLRERILFGEIVAQATCSQRPLRLPLPHLPRRTWSTWTHALLRHSLFRQSGVGRECWHIVWLHNAA